MAESALPVALMPVGIPAQYITPNVAQERVYDGQIPSLGYELLRSVGTTGYQLLEEQQAAQWAEVLSVDTFSGHYIGDVQNIRIVVAPAFLVPATLDASYGIVGDTPQGVLRNIASRTPLFEG